MMAKSYQQCVDNSTNDNHKISELKDVENGDTLSNLNELVELHVFETLHQLKEVFLQSILETYKKRLDLYLNKLSAKLNNEANEEISECISRIKERHLIGYRDFLSQQFLFVLEEDLLKTKVKTISQIEAKIGMESPFMSITRNVNIVKESYVKKLQNLDEETTAQLQNEAEKGDKTKIQFNEAFKAFTTMKRALLKVKYMFSNLFLFTVSKHIVCRNCESSLPIWKKLIQFKWLICKIY